MFVRIGAKSCYSGALPCVMYILCFVNPKLFILVGARQQWLVKFLLMFSGMNSGISCRIK